MIRFVANTANIGCSILFLGLGIMSFGCRPSSSPNSLPTSTPFADNSVFAPPPFDDVEEGPFPRQRRGPIFTMDQDFIANWKPRTLKLSDAATNFADSLRARSKDLLKSQMLMVESGHIIRDRMQKAEIPLEDEDRLFAAEAVYQQACVYAETKHIEYAIEALEVATSLGFNDVNRLRSRFNSPEYTGQDRFEALVKHIELDYEKELDFRIEIALESFAPRTLDFPPLESLEGETFVFGKHEWYFFYCMGMTYEPCLEMLPYIESTRQTWKEQDIEWSLMLFEAQARRSEFPVIRRFVESKSIRFPVYICQPETYAAFHDLVSLPSIVITDRDGIVKGAISGVQTPTTIDHMLKALMNNASK